MRLYLDYNATTPVDPAVLDAMLPYFAETFGNASSIHSRGAARAWRGGFGPRIRCCVARREAVGNCLHQRRYRIRQSRALRRRARRRKSRASTSSPLPSSITRSSMPLKRSRNSASTVTCIPVGREGIVDPEDIRRALRPETIVISVMHANNELGTIQPIEEIGRIAATAEVCFHCDAVQSAGKLPLDVNRLGVDLLSISAHKIYGPKGVGALYVRSGTPLEAQFHGGHHERDRRPGTENVPGIVGMGKAADLARKNLMTDCARITSLRNRLEDALVASCSDARVNGNRAQRVSNTSNVAFPAAGGEALVIALDLQGIACSTGAACSSGAVEPFARAHGHRTLARRSALEPAIQPGPHHHGRRN